MNLDALQALQAERVLVENGMQLVIDDLTAERDSLQAKITALEGQEAVAWLRDTTTIPEMHGVEVCRKHATNSYPVFRAAGATPANNLHLSELMRGLEIPPTAAAMEPGQLFLIGQSIARQAKSASDATPASAAAPEGYKLVPIEVVDLYDYMCAAFVPLTSQQEQIDIQLNITKTAMLAAAPQPASAKVLTDEEIEALGHRIASVYTHRSDPTSHSYGFVRHTLIDFARAVLAAREGIE